VSIVLVNTDEICYCI